MRKKTDNHEFELGKFSQPTVDLECVADFDGNLNLLNPAWRKTLGWTKKELRSKPFFDFVHPDDRELTIEAVKGLRKGKHLITFENRFLCKDRSYKWLSWSATGVLDKKEIYAIARDITGVKKHEITIQKNNMLLKALEKAYSEYITNVDPHDLFDELLGNLLNITKSEYGFIGEVLYGDDKKPYLKTHAITNIAWNKETRKFYEENAPQGMEFNNLKTLFGKVMTSGKPVIANMPAKDPRSGGLPNGHPDLNAFLGIPFFVGTELIGMVGIANRPGGYDLKLIDYLKPFLAACAHLIDGYRNVKHRKLAVKALRENEERIRAIISTVIDGIITIDSHGRIEFFNAGAEKIFGYKHKEVVGKNVNMLMAQEYSQNHDTYLKNYLTTKIPKIIGKRREVLGKRKDGSIFPIELGVGEMLIGERTMFTGIITDITDRKKAEEKSNYLLNQLNVILNSVGDAIVVTNNEMRITTVNPVFLDLIEDKESNVVGKLINDVVQCVDDDGEINIHMNSHIVETVTKGITTECRSQIEISDGRTRAIGSINSPLKDSKGNIIGVVLSMRDISKEVEIDRMKTEFISTVSHELRTPLTSIKGYIDLILEGDTGDINDLQREFLEIVFDNTERLNNLIDALLDIEKIESGEVRTNIKKVSLSDLLGTTLKIMQTSADKKGLKLSSNIPDGAEIYADKDRIVRLFVNLFSNAIKYTKEGEVFIKLTKMKTIHKVVVRDTGIGISKHDQKKIFTRFFRSDDDYAKSAGGTGLGLSIVKAIVEMHGGKIELKSELNKGSEFIVTFPLNHIPDRKK
ncbi:PAS domain S-box protein [candidate division KSB1 bacterium]|nr:PAS domain S-box protein [candidate division KSB1 bacterium]